ncbi:response regulator transcription factor [Mucilaginibacter sp.]|uniref:helix-turn-helix transcriptional regulator n=1 Tax=Mucilaginibacter sp. TaxID=1882438 RepID=UPI0025EDC23C|nr:response regulator transcription factor [Mucilaginibacter sp.]
MKQVVIAFGLLITALLILFGVAKFYSIGHETSGDFWIGAFSLLFLVIGILLSRKLFAKTIVVNHQQPVAINHDQLLQSGISKREAEILLLIHEGLSNQQIADKLFVSENTIKKHISNIFQKLQVERRTEAIKKALELSIIK